MSKKILIVNPNTLFPVTKMSQVRTINLIKRLSQDHEVDVATICRSPKEIEASREGLKEFSNNFHPIEPQNPKTNLLKRKYHGIKFKLLYWLFGVSKRYASLNSGKVVGQLKAIIEKNKYDILQVEYWYWGGMFPRLPKEVFKVIDSHAMVEENMETFNKKQEKGPAAFFRMREYKKSIKLQYDCFRNADLVLNISKRGNEILKEHEPDMNGMVVPIGQEIERFSGFPTAPEKETIMFFGSMGSQQNTRAFHRLYNKIVPLIKEKIPNMKLLVVGSNPPEDIKKLHDGDKVIITGFVDDPREYMAKANIKIVPLETGSGFRGRIVEVMAMGIPVLGTHNALDNIELTDGVHGFISDDDKVLADTTVRLIQDDTFREKISKQGLDFVTEHYSNEATAGKLATYYLKLII